jgi:hypothetical protein
MESYQGGKQIQEMRQMQYSFLVLRMLLKVGSGIIGLEDREHFDGTRRSIIMKMP